MEALFQNTAVDGWTSCIPRLSNVDAPEDEDDEVETEGGDDEDYEMSTPSTVNSRKRPSTADTTSNPRKSTKRVPVVTIMQGLVTQLEIASTKDEQTLQAISENMVTQFKQREEQAKQAKSEAKKR
jgi:hypothetical protein